MRIVPLLLAVVLAFTSCSSAPKTPRQQRVYEKYLKKRAAEREKQQAKIRRKQAELPPQPPPTEPVITTSVGE
jgi:hypothetical protein